MESLTQGKLEMITTFILEMGEAEAAQWRKDGNE
jgi:hypothetical protein